MSLIEKNVSPLDKVADKMKKIARFLFNSEGTITGLQYFYGMFFLNLLIFVTTLTEEIIFGAVISLICLYSMVVLIQKRSRDLGEKGTLSIVLISLAGFISEYNKSFHLDDTAFAVPYIVIVLCGVVAGFRLLFVKGKPNTDMVLQSPLARYPAVTAIVIAVIYVGSFVFGEYIVPESAKKRNMLYETAGVLYRNTEGIPEYCRKLGYELKFYPQRFVTEFEPEISFLYKESAKWDISMDETFKAVNQSAQLKNGMEQSIENELKEIRFEVIISFLAERDKISPQEVEWKDEYNDLLPLSSACRYYDELAQGDDFYQTNAYLYMKGLIEQYKSL